MYVEFEHASREQIKDMFVKMYKAGRSDKKTSYDRESVIALAEQFADFVPAAEFSPAQIQQYLIPHRTRPQEAVDGIKDWVKDKLATGTFAPADRSELGDDYVKVEPKATGVSRLFHGGAERGSDQTSLKQSGVEGSRGGAWPECPPGCTELCCAAPQRPPMDGWPVSAPPAPEGWVAAEYSHVQEYPVNVVADGDGWNTVGSGGGWDNNERMLMEPNNVPGGWQQRGG